MFEITPYEIAHEYVSLVAKEAYQIRFRLRRYRPEAQADIIRIATERLTGRGVPRFINASNCWPIFQRRLSDGRTFKLVQLELDSARHEYNVAVGWSGGPKPGELISRDAEARLARLTEKGNACIHELREREEAEALEERAPAIQAAEYAEFQREAAIENDRYRRELDEYEAQQKKPKHKTAVQLLRRGSVYSEIAKLTCNAEGRRGISEQILKPHYGALREMRNRHEQTLQLIAERTLLTADDGRPYTYDDPPQTKEWISVEESELTEHVTPGTEEVAPWDERKLAPNPERTSGLSGDFKLSHMGAQGDWSEREAAIEEAQFDATNRLDPYDSANFCGAPAQEGFQEFDAGLSSFGGGLRPLTPEQRRQVEAAQFAAIEERGRTWRPELTRIPVGSRVKHAKFGEGLVLAADSDMDVLVNFEAEQGKWIRQADLIVLSGTPRTLSAEEQCARESMQKELTRRVREEPAGARTMKSWFIADAARFDPRRVSRCFGNPRAELAELKRQCAAVGMPLDPQIFGEDAT